MMTQEEKQLLLQDLCARLPYGFLYCYTNEPLAKGKPIILTPVVVSNIMNATDNLVVKPYLRPMSSMTEEELKEFAYIILQQPDLDAVRNWQTADIDLKELSKVSDWLNKNMFDYRGLIEKGLALEATEEMYGTKTE